MAASRSPVTLCGSISHHPAGLGRALHQAGYAALGLPWVYVPFGVDDLDGAIRGMRALGIRGFGVSMPFKRDVMRLCDAIDPLAARIGAVNTVVNDGGTLTGHNTDASGAADALAEAIDVAGQRVLLAGAGGGASAVAHALAERGARLRVVNRNRAAAEALAAAVGQGATAGELAELARLDEVDVVINATPVGMTGCDPDASVVPESALRPGLVVFDIVYKPVRTPLVAAAERRGAKVVHGARMLLHQAFRQFSLYTRQPAPRDAMSAALDAALAR